MKSLLRVEELHVPENSRTFDSTKKTSRFGVSESYYNTLSKLKKEDTAHADIYINENMNSKE